VEQLAHRRQRVVLADWLGAMHSLIAQVFEELRLGENGRADRLSEAGLVDERAQMILIGQCEPAVVLVEPRHGQLQRTPGVEARCARIGIDQPFRLRSGVVQLGPLGFDESEVAHLLGLPKMSFIG